MTKCLTRETVSREAHEALEAGPHEVNDFVFIAAQGHIVLDLAEGVADDGEENGHQPDVDHHDVGEEEDGAQDGLRVGHALEVEGAERESEHALRCPDDVVVCCYHLAKK